MKRAKRVEVELLAQIAAGEHRAARRADRVEAVMVGAPP
jgi:hypothetical protein